jgi:hypothetical protein
MFTALPDRRLWWLVGLLAAAGGGLRSLRLDWQPLWWDEGYSVYFATEPLARMLALTARDIHPPPLLSFAARLDSAVRSAAPRRAACSLCG